MTHILYIFYIICQLNFKHFIMSKKWQYLHKNNSIPQFLSHFNKIELREERVLLHSSIYETNFKTIYLVHIFYLQKRIFRSNHDKIRHLLALLHLNHTSHNVSAQLYINILVKYIYNKGLIIKLELKLKLKLLVIFLKIFS